jgi:hypothetical protein
LVLEQMGRLVGAKEPGVSFAAATIVLGLLKAPIPESLRRQALVDVLPIFSSMLSESFPATGDTSGDAMPDDLSEDDRGAIFSACLLGDC